MQPIVKRLTTNPSLKQQYEEDGIAFNEKHKEQTEKHEISITQGEFIKFPTEWKDFKPSLVKLRPQNETALHYARCFICEKELNDEYAEDVDHYRPKAKKSNADDKQVLQYWWLAYDYRNFCLSCASCNRNKNDVFPLEDESLRVDFANRHQISQEQPLLINPITDYHADFFQLAFVLHPKTINEKIAILLPKKDLALNSLAYKKAKTTIETYCLDMFYMKYQDNLQQNKPQSHLQIIANHKNKEKRNESRLKLLFHFYEQLAVLGEQKLKLNHKDFQTFWATFKTEHPRIANLGLAHLIFLGQFEDLTII
jgi:hypothetical protein